MAFDMLEQNHALARRQSATCWWCAAGVCVVGGGDGMF